MDVVTRAMTSDVSTTVGRAAGATQVRRGGRSAPRHGCQPSGIFGLAVLLAVILTVLCVGCGAAHHSQVAYCRGGVKEVRAPTYAGGDLIVCNEGRVYER